MDFFCQTRELLALLVQRHRLVTVELRVGIFDLLQHVRRSAPFSSTGDRLARFGVQVARLVQELRRSDSGTLGLVAQTLGADALV